MPPKGCQGSVELLQAPNSSTEQHLQTVNNAFQMHVHVVVIGEMQIHLEALMTARELLVTVPS